MVVLGRRGAAVRQRRTASVPTRLTRRGGGGTYSPPFAYMVVSSRFQMSPPLSLSRYLSALFLRHRIDGSSAGRMRGPPRPVRVWQESSQSNANRGGVTRLNGAGLSQEESCEGTWGKKGHGTCGFSHLALYRHCESVFFTGHLEGFKKYTKVFTFVIW